MVPSQFGTLTWISRVSRNLLVCIHVAKLLHVCAQWLFHLWLSHDEIRAVIRGVVTDMQLVQ